MLLFAGVYADDPQEAQNFSDVDLKLTKTTAFDCAGPDNQKRTVSLISGAECMRESKVSNTSTIDVQILQSQEYESKDVVQCMISYDVMIQHCGHWYQGRNDFIKKYNYIYEPTRDQCRQIIKSQHYVDVKNSKVAITLKHGQGSFRGFVAGSSKPGDCTGTEYIDHLAEKHDNVFVHAEIKIAVKESSAHINIRDHSLSLSTGKKCQFTEGNCFDQLNGYSFWELGLNSYECNQKSLFVIYKGTVNKTVETLADGSSKTSYYSVSDGQLFYIEATAETHVCGYAGFTTQHPKIFLTEIMETHHQFFFNNAYSAKNIDGLIIQGMQLSLLYNNVGVQMSKMYDSIQYSKCLTDQKLIATSLSVAKLDPTSLGLVMHGKPGYFTKISGEVAYIIQCRPVEVTLRSTDVCYNEIPIYYNNEKMFITPRSHIITNVGTILDCKDFLIPAYKINNIWFSLQNNRLNPIKTPIDMEITKPEEWLFKPIENLANQFIYSPQDIRKYRESINNPLSQEAIRLNQQNEISGKFQTTGSTGSVAYFVTHDLIDKIQERFFEDSFNYLSIKFTSLGNVVSAMFGIFMIFKAIKFIINLLFNSFLLHDIFGFTWKLLFSFWDSLVHFWINRENARNNDMRFDAIDPEKQSINPDNDNISENEKKIDDEKVVSYVVHENHSIRVPEYHQIHDEKIKKKKNSKFFNFSF